MRLSRRNEGGREAAQLEATTKKLPTSSLEACFERNPRGDRKGDDPSSPLQRMRRHARRIRKRERPRGRTTRGNNEGVADKLARSLLRAKPNTRAAERPHS